MKLENIVTRATDLPVPQQEGSSLSMTLSLTGCPRGQSGHESTLLEPVTSADTLVTPGVRSLIRGQGIISKGHPGS